MALSQGTRLGPYEVRSFISEGGMGEVYAAYDPRLGRQVAIKALTRPLAELPEFRRRFEQETQAISRLNHKNICTIFDTGLHEGRPYIVMELIEGKTLEQLLESGPLSVERVLHIGIQVAAALDAAHKAGVVHRDVKSSNIILNSHGDAKVLDFGLAMIAPEAQAREKEPITRAGAVVGTVNFMSPEQVRGEDVDARSDLFSLGVVLYQMATGVPPFRGSPTSIVAQLVSPDPVPGPRSLEPALPMELDRIISRALEKDRAMRYQTAADLLAALRALRRDLVTGVSRASGGHEWHRVAERKPWWRRQLPWAVGAVVIATGGFLAWRQLSPGFLAVRPIRSIAVLPCMGQTADAGTEYFCSLLRERINNGLSQVPGLTPPPSTEAVTPFLGQGRSAIGIGSSLHVDAVFTAQVRKHADSVSVIVEVTDVRTGAHVWGNVFGPTTDAQGLPEQIARQAVDSLQLRLTATDRARLQVLQTYQQAQYYLGDRSAASLRKAISLDDEVIRADSTFAKAYVGLASAYILLHYYGDLAPAGSYPRARVAAQQALDLDESLADAHAALGLVLRDYDRNWTGAERQFQRALQLNPQSPDALQWYAELLTMTRRFAEAEARIKEAQTAAPLSLPVRAVHGWILMSAGRFEDARRELEATIAMDQNFELSHWFLGQLNFAEKDYPAAVKAFEASIKSSRPSRRVADLASASAFAGDRRKAQELLRELQTRQQGGEYVSGYDLAIVFAGLGDRDRAFQELEGA
ncbi:MAG: protein kinase, partial [Gemmatimonadetes bacterium]|nr:protein kinase [Gemmatimonadota bacterium]